MRIRKETWSEASFSGQTRKMDGAMITFRRLEDGRLLTRSCQLHPVMEAIKILCREIELTEGTWVVQTISTPGLIWRDMQGLRETPPARGGRFADDVGVKPALFPEAQLLTRAGFSQLYSPPSAVQETRGKRHSHPYERELWAGTEGATIRG